VSKVATCVLEEFTTSIFKIEVTKATSLKALKGEHTDAKTHAACHRIPNKRISSYGNLLIRHTLLQRLTSTYSTLLYQF